MNVLHNASDIKTWLKIALVNEHLTDFSVIHITSSGSKDGYMGDIVFVKISGRTVEDIEKEYDLVLKCGKTSKALRETLPVKETYENEIYIYSKVFPAFTKFQHGKKIVKIFDSIPLCYGTVLLPDIEIIVFDNLNISGYKLHDRKKPLSMEHINLILQEYGKFHAVSAALEDQYPEKYKKLVSGIKDVWKGVEGIMDPLKLFGTPIEECRELLKEDISQHASEKLKKFKELVPYITNELIYDRAHFTVITHGDCWNNNFMFKYQEGDINNPVRVAMLDWQLSQIGSPVLDVSYFLYSCLAPENLRYMEQLLKMYHDSFSTHLRDLGSKSDEIFPYSQLLADWKFFAKFGIMMAFLSVKIAVSDQDETTDFAESIENGKDFNETFNFELRDKDILKNRVLGIVEHIVEKDLI